MYRMVLNYYYIWRSLDIFTIYWWMNCWLIRYCSWLNDLRNSKSAPPLKNLLREPLQHKSIIPPEQNKKSSMHYKILDVNMRRMAKLALCVLGWNNFLPNAVHMCLCSSSCLPALPIKASKVLTCTDSAPLQLAWLGNFWGEWVCICSAHLPVIHVIGWGGIFCWTIPSLSCAALLMRKEMVERRSPCWSAPAHLPSSCSPS